jgi:hypothetical protein
LRVAQFLANLWQGPGRSSCADPGVTNRTQAVARARELGLLS